jgi:hypothetical protein
VDVGVVLQEIPFALSHRQGGTVLVDDVSERGLGGQQWVVAANRTRGKR